MTPRDEQVEAVVEMAITYIAMAETRDVLESLGFEIADLKTELKITAKELEQVKTAYFRRRTKIQEAGSERGA